MAEHKYTNKLIQEKSPYLLQHAYNPVNWYPWGEEAFSVAAAKDLPIFLSIGYSTCHWCHVMAHESFEDTEVAELLNKEYVAIKVDREERPDIDSIYMSVCQALTGQGGWPMTIIMTPDKKPFFAGTYFPKHNRMGMPGLITILERTSEAWKDSRESILDACSGIADSLHEQNTALEQVDYKRLITAAYEQYKTSFDSMHGGFGNAPKFPSPHILGFLLRYWKLTGSEAALKMTEKTLDAMRRGGIFDHIGYGFCRYSTDRTWLIPHFEKMLYDNALLAIANLEAYQASGNGSYAGTAREIFAYVLRDMTSPEGAFYSAEDADSEDSDGHMEEGRFYTWTPEEVRSVIGKGNDAERFMVLINITGRGNFEGRSIPNTINGSIPGSDLEFVELCREKLFENREKRKHPFKDDKILASWNGLMIAAMAMGGRILDDPSYTSAAEKAAQFVLTKLIDENGRLLAVYRGGASPLKAYADDYTFMVWGLLELYETTYKPQYLRRAVELSDSMIELFWDNDAGGLFMYGADSEQLIARPKEGYDGAMPSANSVAANNFIRLARLTGNSGFEDKAHRIIKAFSGSMDAYPAGFSHMLNAVIMLETGGNEVIVAGRPEEGAAELIEILRQGFRPFTVTMHYDKDTGELAKLIPYIADYSTVDGKAAAYVCRNFTCNRPATDAAGLNELLQ